MKTNVAKPKYYLECNVKKKTPCPFPLLCPSNQIVKDAELVLFNLLASIFLPIYRNFSFLTAVIPERIKLYEENIIVSTLKPALISDTDENVCLNTGNSVSCNRLLSFWNILHNKIPDSRDRFQVGKRHFRLQ